MTASPDSLSGVLDPSAKLAGFARALRAAGVSADISRLVAAVAALDHLDPLDLAQVYWATRVTMCSEPDDLPRFDPVFATWFGAPSASTVGDALQPFTSVVSPVSTDWGPDAGTPAPGGNGPVHSVAASDQEILRTRDVGQLSAQERREVERMIALLRPRVGTRRSLRRSPHHRGRVDTAGTVRSMLRTGGEPVAPAHWKQREKPRRLVLLIDVSGSMAPYSDALLRFAHAAVRVRPSATEVFTLGTRLTRVTRALRARDPAAALGAAARTVPDWSGGTRLGESLRAFLNLWGQRGVARGAVVVIASDGWERGDAALLGGQLERLARLARTVVWVNPHKGKEGFEPSTAGMVAALPHVDRLVAGHSFQALVELVDVIGQTRVPTVGSVPYPG